MPSLTEGAALAKPLLSGARRLTETAGFSRDCIKVHVFSLFLSHKIDLLTPQN